MASRELALRALKQAQKSEVLTPEDWNLILSDARSAAETIIDLYGCSAEEFAWYVKRGYIKGTTIEALILSAPAICFDAQ